MLNIALGIFFVGLILLGLSRWAFKIRAIANMKAWNGPVLPLAIAGSILLLVSLTIIYVYYPK